MLTRVFVYGTLKQGGELDRKDFAKRRVSVKNAKIQGSLYNISWFPGIKLGGKNVVHGEVHEFKKEDMGFIIRSMDRIEGYDLERREEDNLYVRRIVVAKTKDGEKLKAYVYEFNNAPPEKRLVKSGVWEPNV
jgi:gamma-glutamylcyclotransferase (GGCT)/AIG2-like uncharacterized protein YtfP